MTLLISTLCYFSKSMIIPETPNIKLNLDLFTTALV